MTERRYSEEEVAAVFERATKAQQTARRHLTPGEGITMADLQEIGQEVGISAELVAEAALSLDRPGGQSTRSFVGFPIGVDRTIDLGRPISDEEWEHLVVDLRETFDARGRLSSQGSLKQWTNGNLQALLEPTASGHRLRLRTTNGNARALMSVGTVMAGVSAALVVATTVAGGFGQAIAANGTLLLVGVGLFALGAARLPMWARRRRQQMEAVAERLALASRTPEAGGRLPRNGEGS